MAAACSIDDIAPSRFIPPSAQITPLVVSHASISTAILNVAPTASFSEPVLSADSNRAENLLAMSDMAEGASRLVAKDSTYAARGARPHVHGGGRRPRRSVKRLLASSSLLTALRAGSWTRVAGALPFSRRGGTGTASARTPSRSMADS